MKSLLKIGVLSLFAAQLMVGCGDNSKTKEKQKTESKKTKALKKGAKVDPTAGCD